MVQEICRSWLDTETVPNSVRETNNSNPLLSQIHDVFKSFCTASAKKTCLKRKSNGKVSLVTKELEAIKYFYPEQLLIFLELVLKCPTIDLRRALLILNDLIVFQSCNAEIQHRLCEIIVKVKHCQFYSFLKEFLIENQALGIYLYGELALSNHKALKAISKEVFSYLSEEYDPSQKQNISEYIV